MYEYKAKYLKTIDGDTADFLVDLGFSIQTVLRIRLSVVDTPERGEVGWAEATAFTKAWLETNQDVVIRTEHDKAGGFGRYLGTVYSLDGTEVLNQLLLDNGLAKVYSRDSIHPY